MYRCAEIASPFQRVCKNIRTDFTFFTDSRKSTTFFIALISIPCFFLQSGLMVFSLTSIRIDETVLSSTSNNTRMFKSSYRSMKIKKVW